MVRMPGMTMSKSAHRAVIASSIRSAAARKAWASALTSAMPASSSNPQEAQAAAMLSMRSSPAGCLKSLSVRPSGLIWLMK